MNKNRRQNILKRILEGIVTIALVLLFFVILIMVFDAVFPEGSSLLYIFKEKADVHDQARQGDSSLKITQGENADLLSGDDNWDATLVQTRNAVKSKKADDIVWKSAPA